MKKMPLYQKIALILFGLFLSLVLLEIGIRMGGFAYLSLQKHRNRTTIGDQGTYRIMCLGESTTVAGGRNSYPSQLEEILNRRDTEIKFRVINKGIPATDTEYIVSSLSLWLSEYRPNMVIAMMGINDERYRYFFSYKDNPAGKFLLFLNSLRTYKLVRFLYFRIANKRKALFKEPIEADSERYNTYDCIDPLCWRLGRYSEAEKILKKDIEINPKNTKTYQKLGWLYAILGRYDQAEEVLEKAIEANPGMPDAYIELGSLYRKFEKYDQAEEMFKKAIELDPKRDDAYIKLGWIYKRLGKYDRAEETLKKAMNINPESSRVYGALAVLYTDLDEHSLAEEYYRKAEEVRKTYNVLKTYNNYRLLQKQLAAKGIKLVCVQYPMRNIEPLKKIFKGEEDIIFVDNEKLFKEAVEKEGYNEYFTDMFGGDFGHCTPKGNRLLAENIANTILKERF
ncbi:MAG: hypothetical protein A2Z72_01695 [Omnitrophica bacterium RBG_13_46_9]|nr:MAG: hypothetical protein A2Z72_01695 [Omnitrophica bacterium RBG_13_46_9]